LRLAEDRPQHRLRKIAGVHRDGHSQVAALQAQMASPLAHLNKAGPLQRLHDLSSA